MSPHPRHPERYMSGRKHLIPFFSPLSSEGKIQFMSKSTFLALNSLQLVSRSRQLLEAEKELESAVKKSEAAAIELQKRTIDAEQREGRVAELDAKVQQEQVSVNV